MRELVIQPKEEGKGRSFVSTLLASVQADALWARSSADSTRPVYMMFGGTENELRPFIANLQLGRKAEYLNPNRYSRTNDKLEVLKSVGYQTVWQRTPHGATVTMFLPELFRLDPGMVDPTGVTFVILPEKKWLASVEPNAAALDHIKPLASKATPEQLDWILRIAPLFIAYLDRRTRCPLINDVRFYAQVLVNALSDGLASFSSETHNYHNREWGKSSWGFKEIDTDDIGLAPGLAFRTTHEVLEAFLAAQVKFFFNRTKASILPWPESKVRRSGVSTRPPFRSFPSWPVCFRSPTTSCPTWTPVPEKGRRSFSLRAWSTLAGRLSCSTRLSWKRPVTRR